eukprot:SAG22_NODE_11455_length_484_cov_1.015584_1_plen_25_part_10
MLGAWSPLAAVRAHSDTCLPCLLFE